MGGSSVIHATLAQLATGATMPIVVTAASVAAAHVWQRAGFQRHLRRLAEIGRRIALRSPERALA